MLLLIEKWNFALNSKIVEFLSPKNKIYLQIKKFQKFQDEV